VTEQTQRTFRGQTDYKTAFAAAVTKLIECEYMDGLKAKKEAMANR